MSTVRLLLAVALLTSGCAFGTDHVKLSSAPSTAIPERGAAMHVQVKDARPEAAGTQVGFKRNGYGAKTGSVELGEPLSGLLTRDLVSLLRDRGYRAEDAHDASGTPDLLVDAEIVNFIVDVKQGFWSGGLEGISVLRLTILDAPTRRQVWSDIVRAEARKSGLQFVSEEDHQEVVERLYRDLLTNVRAVVPDGRARLGGLSQPSESGAAP